MVLQGRKSSPQKSRPPESGHRRHGVWIAIEYSYKLGQKKEFKFLCVPGWFSQIRSHIKILSGYSRVEFQADNAQLVRSTGVNVSVMVLQGRKSSPQKSRPPESGHRRHGVWIAIEYSYKLGQKKEFKFLCVPGWFSQIRSQLSMIVLNSRDW